MRERRANRLSAGTFLRKLQGERFAIVLVGSGPFLKFTPGLLEYFNSAFPDGVYFGVFDRQRVTGATWWADNFRTAVGAIRMGARGPQDGYYLFEFGMVVRYHTGALRTTDAPRYRTDRELEEDAKIAGRAFAGRTVSSQERALAIQLITYFQERMGRPKADWTHDEPSPPPPPPRDHHRPPPGGRPPPRHAPPPVGDPYEVLGVAPSAGDANVKRAYREQMRLNHPDKVAHLSPSIQKFAEQQTLAIQAAYEKILAMRK